MPVQFSKLHLEPKNQTFSEAISNGKLYQIPKFQRDYSWEIIYLDELWQDIEEMIANGQQHFMGYLVLQSEKGKLNKFQVIDGQQRLTTLSLLMLALLHHLQNMANNEKDSEKNRTDNQARFSAIHDRYLGVFDAITLKHSPKLTLNRHNQPHFNRMIKNYDIVATRGIIKTNRRLNNAFKFFKEKTASYQNGEAIAELIENIGNGLLFTTITVENDVNAYLVFETLNARGIQLSTPDLLKNYLLSTLSKDSKYDDESFNAFEEKWEYILTQLGETDFTNFLRSHMGMTASLPSKKELFSRLKKNINEADHVMPYLQNIEKMAPVYSAVQKPHDDFWHEHDAIKGKIRAHLDTLDLFNIKTPYSLLMAAYDTYMSHDSDKFLKILEWIAIISIRYNVICNRPANEQENRYNHIAREITSNHNLQLSSIKMMLKTIYPDDNIIKSSFTDKTLPSKQSSKKIRFLLSHIEKHLSNGHLPSDDLTIEHILPQNPDDDWQQYFGYDSYETAIDRLGNMALLTKGQNMAQEPFADKQKILQQSNYKINQHIATEYSEWNIENLAKHQKWLAHKVISIWKIEGL
ncbi:MAG: DUF262 domain-containing HNH endonuclease family protein [Alphaproteobacteria bacterium]|nr:DUF262 domain-containing HNH endonuclease family protein [Alphaproteobacteria bacterium]